MKIDRSKLKKSSSEVSADCQELIERLKSCPDLLAELQQIKAWNYGKSELYQWVDVLDKFDAILEEARNTPPDHSWHLTCDRPENKHLEDLVHAVLTFTALLVEHSFSRHLYNSVEHLTALLASSNLNTVLAVLNLVYVFSKRSNFLIKLSQGKRQELFQALTYLAESWGGKDNGFGLAECCQMGEKENIPNSATTLHFEFYSDNVLTEEKVSKKHSAQALTIVHIENVDKLSRDCAAIMEELISKHNIPKDKQMLLFTHVRLAHCFSNPEQRLLCVQARLQALSVLVYSSAIQDITSTLLYTGLVEELVDVLQIQNPLLVEIKAASLRTLTAIIHLDRNPELVNIIEATGASSYHGFLPVLVRQCIQAMIDPQQEAVPHVLATALFSFLYHLASYGTGGEALVFCNMMESLLKVIKWHGEDEQLHTTFVTRAVRVVDLITNLDMAAFQTNGGLSIFLNRLEHEVNICRNEVPYVIRPTIRTSTREPSLSNPASPSRPFESDASTPAGGGASTSSLQQGESSGLPTSQSGDGPSEMETDSPGPSSSSILEDSYLTGIQEEGKSGRQCFPQRAALLKSMLNFLKKAIPDPAFADSIRHVMDGSLPRSLKHLISNAEYYGPSLFLLACEFVTVYVFQEPSLLSCLQDTGLTDVMLHALLIKDVPATKEVLGSLPNIFSALCLNARGLEAFVKCKPFDKLFKVLLSPAYLPAMRRRRSNEIMGDTALSLGSAMDELMRHQPSLKSDAMKAIIKLLEEICSLGRDKRYTCAKTPPKGKTSAASAPQTAGDDTSSDDDDDEEAVTEEIRNPTEVTVQKREADLPQSTDSEEKKPIPLLDYIFNVMKFVEAILCTNATDDHCWEFVGQKGHEPLMEILRLPNLPIDFPSSQACQSVASVCKAILSLAREPQVLKQGLQLLKEVLQKLEPLNQPLQPPGGSILLKELLDSPNPPEAPLSAGATPLLHSVVSAHSYVTMLFHVCRVGQGDVRTISINQWGTDLGQDVLRALCKLYTSLVWESIVLLSLFTPGSIPENCELGKQDMTKLMELTADMQEGKKAREQAAGSTQGLTASFGPGESPTTAVSSALSSMEMEDAQPSEEVAAPKDTKSTMNLHMLHQLKQEVPALYAPSRLGRALSELFGLLVKLCVGSSMRHRIRPNPQANQTVPSEAARKTARTLMELLMSSLQWRPPTADALPKFRLTFYICTVSFASPMLFDDKKQPYHLMLQKFVSSGAHQALFEAFNWALSPDNPFDKEGSKDLSEGTCEFIDAWLVLIKKMVNPESVLESPHAMPAKSTQQGFVPFQPVQFLINTHKAAFHSLMKLWSSGHLKNLGSRTSESVLSILCHILRGESVIAERLKQAKAEEGPSGSSEGVAGTSGALSSRSRLGGASSSFLASEILGGWGSSRQRQEPSEEHILQLMDMGFSRDHAIDALNHTASLPQAAEWAISHQPRLTQDLSTGMSEEEEMLQAIAMSLGETLVSTPNKADEEEKKKKEEEEKKKKEEEQKKLEAQEKIPEEEPLRKEDLDNFVNGMLPGCLALMDDVPDIVARVCDVLVIANERNGSEWRDNMLQTLIGQIAENALLLEQLALDDSSKLVSTEENRNQLNSVPQAPRLAARIHLLCLLFDEMKMSCARMIESSGVLDVFVRLVHVSQQYLRTSKDAATPKWLAPLLLLLDLYEKAVVSFRRKLAWVNTASHQWKWFDDSSGRWCPYSRGNNKTIDDAFWAGKSSVRFTAARRRYIVNFNRMVQVNEETMNRRPIMQALKTEEVPKKEEETTKGNKKQKTETGASEAGTSSQSLGASASDEKEQVAKQPDIVEVEGLSEDQMTSLLRSCIGLIGVPVEPDALHAVLRLCLRFTRNHQHALMFADMGGPRLLLSLTLSSSFNGFSLLATLLLRHIFESKSVLTNTMEKLISTVANKGVGCLTCNVALGSVGSRELHYALRMLGPPACRDEEVYLKAAKSCLKVDVPNSKREISHSTNPNTMLLLKGISPPEMQPTVTLDEHAKQVLSDLLESLVIPVEPMEETKAPETKKEVGKEKGTGKTGDTAEMVGVGLREIGDELLCFYSADRQSQRSGTSSASGRMETGMDATVLGEDELPEAGSIISMASSSSSQGKKSTTEAATTPETKSKPLISKSAILRLLAELVKPYLGCAQYVAQYQFVVCQTPHVKEDGSALAFILDNLLPQMENTGDKDCPAQAQVLLASLASCNHSPEAQATLVSEVKGALQRALALPESKEKHARIQALTLLISVMIDACPSTATTPSHTTGTGGSPAAAKGQTPTVNNITRLLLKKGFVTDLARITHSLDLSSPNMAATINSALKPLDTLSRMVNQAPAGSKGSLKSKMGRNDILRTSRSSRPRTTGGSTLRTSNTVHTELEEIVGELLEQQERRPDVLGETLIAAGPERLDSFQSSFLNQGGEDASQDEMVITMTEDGADIEQTPRDSEMQSQPSQEEEESVIPDFEVEEENDSAADSESERADEEGQDDEADDDEEEEEDDEADEDDDDSDMEEAEEYDITEDLDYFRMGDTGDRDNDFFIPLDEVSTGETVRQSTIPGLEGRYRSYQMPVTVHDDVRPSTGITGAGAFTATTPSATHPLLVRHTSDDAGTSHTSAQTRNVSRGARQRLHVRPGTGNSQTVHIYHSGAHRPLSVSAVLRLLGMSSTSDVVQVSQTGNQTRVYVSNSNNELGGGSSTLSDDILNLDDGMRETFRDGYLSSSDLSSNVTPVYKRWDEEASILDGESMFDCIEALKRPIIEVLEKRRDQEIAEKKEKMKKQAEEEAKKKAEEAKKVKQAAAKAEAKALLGLGKKKSSGGVVGGEAVGAAASTVEEKDEEERMEISENGEKTSGEPSSAASDEAVEIAPTSEPCGAAAAAVATTSSLPTAPTPTPGADVGAIGGVLQLSSSLPDFELAEQPQGSSTPMASPATAGGEDKAERPSSTSPMETSTQQVEAQVPTTVTTTTTSPGTLTPSLTTAATSSTDAVTGVTTTTSATASATTTTQSSTHPVSTILSTTGEVTLNTLLTGTASNIGAASTTPLQSGDRVMAESALVKAGTEGGGTTTTGATGTSDTVATAAAAAVGGDLQLPEGVDPSFLAALPDNIRQEVLQEHLGIQSNATPSSGVPKPPTTSTTTTTTPTTNSGTTGETPATSQVDPEFLAALPPHIQEEVLAEERAEQQRLQQASQQQTAAAASSEPMDPAAFIQTLPRSLRQSVLSDLDHSMLALLPADLAAEAQALRLECARVIRRRQLLQERYIRESGRISGITGQGMNYYRLSAPRRTGASWANDFGHRPQSRIGSNLLSGSQVQGRQLVDLEALTCLLVLLFLNEPKLNLVRLWRVLRNLSFHPPTRNWILLSLLSILEKTKACRTVESQRSSEGQSPVGDMEAPFSSKNALMPSWLSVSMDAALGCRASIFQVQRGNRKGSDRQPANVFIHPQAASMVCQNVLDTLYALADDFPQQFIPDPVAHAKILKQKDDSKMEMKESDETIPPESGAIQKGSHQKSEPDFWELLVKLDSTSLGRKGKGTSKPTLLLSGKDIKEPSWGDSPVARLLAMLSHPVVKRSTALTDKLLHLLTLVTASLPDKEKESAAGSGPGTQRQAPTSSRSGTTAPSAMAVSVPSCQSTEGPSEGIPGETVTPMDTSTTGDVDTLKVKIEGTNDEKAEEKTLVEESLLQLAVEVLTTHTCSGDGLEEATTLLMQLSRSHSPTREAVLRLLLNGAQDLGLTLCRDINQLKTEVTDFLRKQKEQESMGDGDGDEPSTSSGATPGILVDRYNQSKKVVVSVPASGSKRSGFELRLPSMVSFTGKTANQTVFLRILKVIIQLRDLAKATPASKAKSLKQGGEYSEMSNAVAALARSASEMMAQRESERQSSQASSETATVSSASAGASSTTTTPSVGTVTPAPDAAVPSEAGSSAMATPVSSGTEVPMEVDPAQKPEAGTSSQEDTESTKAEDDKENLKEPEEDLERLSLLLCLEELWETLSVCLTMLSQTPDPHAVLVLQPAVEAFFLVHASDKNTAKASETQLQPLQSSASEASQSSSQPATPSLGSVPSGLFFSRESSVTSIVTPNMPADTQKFLRFAEKHRSVLNQILRQSTVHLSEGPFAVLVNHVRILDFDVKRRYFRQELERLDEGSRREDMAIHVRREHVFEDSYRELHRKSAEHWKDKFYVVFEGEEGQDAGGLLREWYLIISKEIFNPMYALFRTSPGDRVTYIPNPSSHYNPNHLSYFKFVGRIIAKAIYDNKLLECYFSRSFYKHILGKPVTYSDMESEDYAFYQGLVFLLEHHISELGYELTFSTEIDVFGVTETRELKEGGATIPVTEDNKLEYVRLVCQMKMTHAISQQIRSFLEGFHEIIPKRLISIFDEQELELLISGLPTVDVDDLKANTEYHKYQSNSLQIQWFWRALRSFDQALRAKFIQFVTGTSKVPLQGFGSLEGMNGPQKFQIHRDDRCTDRLPTAHTCFNQLDLPAYETYDKLRQMLLLAIEECPEGFGLA